MTYQQPCGTCVGARSRWTAAFEREQREASTRELRALRLERRKERPHRVARFVQEAIELRFEAAQHRATAKHAFAMLLRIPATTACPSCGGTGIVVSPGTMTRGVVVA